MINDKRHANLGFIQEFPVIVGASSNAWVTQSDLWVLTCGHKWFNPQPGAASARCVRMRSIFVAKRSRNIKSRGVGISSGRAIE